MFQTGELRYAITLREDGSTQRRIVIHHPGGSCRHDLDLAVGAQRQRTAGNLALQLGLPVEVIAGHLVGLLASVQAHEEAKRRGPVVEVQPQERAAAEAFLASPDLLKQVEEDLSSLGWIGESRTKQLLFLTAISRLLPQPVWALHLAEGASPWADLATVAQLLPPEEVRLVRQLNPVALRQLGGSAAAHRLLVLDQAEGLRPDAALALRLLKERSTDPVAVLAAAAGELDPRCRSCFLTVTADQTPAQTEAILAQQRLRLHSTADPAPILARHHAAQRLLERRPVVIPFIDRVVFPSTRVRHREEQRWPAARRRCGSPS